jgi:hypothetical protein
MRAIFAACLLYLSACTQQPAAPKRPALLAFEQFGCPILSESAGYTVRGIRGPDYTICKLTPREPGLLPAELRIGGNWSLSEGAFAGYSSSAAGDVAWFYGTGAAGGSERIAFIPTGLRRPAVVQLVIRGGRSHEVARQRDALLAVVVRASMRPNNSSKPTPLRGAA